MGAGLIAASFGVLYMVAIRHQQQAGLYHYWDERFADWSRPWTLPLWTARGLNSVFNYPIRNTGPVLLGLGVLGAVGLWRSGRSARQREAMLLVAPLLVALAAGAAGRYPFPGQRLTVYLAPGLCWLAGAGLGALMEWIGQSRPGPRAARPTWRVAVLAIAFAPAALALLQDVEGLFDPPHRGQIRPAVRVLLAEHDPGEPVVVLDDLDPFQLYALQAGERETLVPLLHDAPDAPQGKRREVGELIDDAGALAEATGEERFWVIFDYDRPGTRRRLLSAVDAAAPGAIRRADVDGAVLVEVSR